VLAGNARGGSDPQTTSRSSRSAGRRRKLAAAIGATTLGIVAVVGASPALAVNAAQSSVVSAKPASFTPQVPNGAVIAIVQVGSKIIAAGSFTSVKQTLTSASITRNRIFAFDATTGTIDPNFNPNLNGSVNSLATDGTYVYLGGSFTTVGGVSSPYIAKLTASGTLVPGLKAPNKVVNEVVVRGSRLYIGGAFTTVGGSTTPRKALAALDTTSGAVLPQVNVPFTGQFNGGTTNIQRFDMNPAGTELVAVGNFAAVGGQTREQVAMIDTPATGNAAVSAWSTDRYDNAHNPQCASVFNTFVRDIDFAPDGSYFAVSATGAFGGGASVGTLCDTVTRWETTPGATTVQEPTWVDYTGGDTTYGVAATGTAIYVGGHMRWENNPYQGDQAGPGAVPREGIAALDPVNGLPLSWNPGRTRGVGAQALYATDQGLWVGSDTNQIGGQTHDRIALMPLAGGTTVPTVAPATLPNNLFYATRPSGTSTGVLFRVNAAGPAEQSTDNGPDWTTDSAYVSGGNTADWGTTVPVDGTVPASTSPQIFATERWGAQSWAFPVPIGEHVQVRLFFANQYDGTSQPGQRVFNVAIDGNTVLNHFDIVATAGNKTGTMQAFDITSDGDVNIDFTADTENPLVNGIEIVDTSGGGGTSTPGTLQRRAVDATGTPTAPATTANSAIDWSLIRGSFYVNGTLYYGLTDGNLYSRTFNPSTGAAGAQTPVNLYNDPDDGTRIPFAIANLTGMFYDTATHRLYYTLFGDGNLYYRYFTPESKVVGALEFTGDNGGVDFSQVRGMTLAGGKILYGSADGSLRSVGVANGAVSGSPSVVSSDGSWVTRGMFVPNS
jgi:hypothetical protein